MRFRLATNGASGGGQELAGGVGNLFRSIAMAPAMAAQASEQARDAQSQMDLRNAQTALYQGKAGEVADQRARTTPGSMLQTAMTTRGVPLHEQPDFGNYLRTGQMPGQYVTPADGVGPVLPAPKIYQDDTAARILQTLGITNTALTVGDSNSLNIAKAVGEYQDQDVMGEAVAAARGGNDMLMSRLNTVRGKKEFTPFAAVGTTGTALNQVTGTQGVANAGLRALFGDKTMAEIEADKARAGASRASAASSYASAAKTNQERELGAKGTLQQTDQGLLLIDPRSGQARAVIGPDGKPAGAKPSGSAGNISEGERKAATLLARLRGSQAQLQAALESNPSAAKPGYAAEAVRAVPLVGGDTPANLLTGETRQQIEAAQLDMLDAALTLGTGAAYTKEQLRGYAKSFFPQIGDEPKTVADKKVRLANVIRSAEIAAGRAEALVPKAPRPSAPGGASGGWDDPGGGSGGGWSIQRVE
jgi:hypothetical protein